MFYVTIARWIYAEALLMVPGVRFVFDLTLDKFQIPTHDRWDRKYFESLLGEENATKLEAQVRGILPEDWHGILSAAQAEEKPKTPTGWIQGRKKYFTESASSHFSKSNQESL